MRMCLVGSEQHDMVVVGEVSEGLRHGDWCREHYACGCYFGLCLGVGVEMGGADESVERRRTGGDGLSAECGDGFGHRVGEEVREVDDVGVDAGVWMTKCDLGTGYAESIGTGVDDEGRACAGDADVAVDVSAEDDVESGGLACYRGALFGADVEEADSQVGTVKAVDFTDGFADGLCGGGEARPGVEKQRSLGRGDTYDGYAQVSAPDDGVWAEARYASDIAGDEGGGELGSIARHNGSACVEVVISRCHGVVWYAVGHEGWDVRR